MSQQSFIKKLFSKWSVWVASLYILLCLIVAIFCYYLAPDSTTFANNSIPAIANLNPGESVDMIRMPRPDFHPVSAWNRLCFGEPLEFEYFPYDSLIPTSHGFRYLEYTHHDTTIHNWNEVDLSNYSGQRQSFLVNKKYWLGTDKQGRDILSRVMVGSRISLSVGLVAVLISISIGIFIGALAGYYGGKIDTLVMWLINVFWAIPTILLVFALVMVIGKGFWQIFIAIGITMWIGPARIIRGQVLSLKQNNYIKATKILGYSAGRVIMKHVLPNLIGTIMVLAAANFATAILIEAGLSFLGVGIQPPMASWGLMVKEQYNYLITDNPLPTLIPGIAIMLAVLSFNILGNALRDATDVRE